MNRGGILIGLWKTQSLVGITLSIKVRYDDLTKPTFLKTELYGEIVQSRCDVLLASYVDTKKKEEEELIYSNKHLNTATKILEVVTKVENFEQSGLFLHCSMLTEVWKFLHVIAQKTI